jgi:hypothetical protein
MSPGCASDRSWLSALRRYALFAPAANLAWEAVHVPLYTIWERGTPAEILFSVVHCTGGDVLIAVACLVVALVLAGGRGWPSQRAGAVALAATAFGLAYTLYSERQNLARGAWAYADGMPVLPWLDVGLSPLLQWLILPPLGLRWAASRPRERGDG